MSMKFLTGDKEFTFDRVIRLAITLAMLWGLITAVDYLSDVLIPFVAAVILAYMINPLVLLFQRKLRVRNRILSVTLALLSMTMLLTILMMFLIPAVVDEIIHMGHLLRQLVADANLDQKSREILPPEVWQYIKELIQSDQLIEFFTPEKIGSILNEAVQKIFPGLWGVFSGAISFLIGFFGLAVILLYLIFILLDYEKFMEGSRDLIPPSYKEKTLEVIEDFTSAMSRYFRAQSLIALSVGVLFAIGFVIIGLPLGIVLGLFIGLLNMIPYMQNIGLIPALFLALLHSLETGDSFWIMLGLIAIVFIAVQIIQDSILTPKIMGEALGLSPVVMLLSLSIWGKLLGMLGLLIALPVTFLIYSYYKKYVLSLASEEKSQIKQ